MAPSGELQLDVQIDSETVWLTLQARSPNLFGVRAPNINLAPRKYLPGGGIRARGTYKDFSQVRKKAAEQSNVKSSTTRSTQSSPSIPGQFQDGNGLPPVGDRRASRTPDQCPPSTSGGASPLAGSGPDRLARRGQDEARALLDVVGRYAILMAHTSRVRRESSPRQAGRTDNQENEAVDAQASACCHRQSQERSGEAVALVPCSASSATSR